MSDVSLGQYYPVKSPVHRLDPRTKLVATVGYIIMLFFIPTLSVFLKNGGTVNGFLLTAGIAYLIILVFLVVTVAFSRMPFAKVLRSIRAIIFLVVFMSVLTVFFYGGATSKVYFEWRFLSVSKEGLINAAAVILRLIFLVMGPAILTLTTTPVELTDGLESLLTPLKWIKFPVHAMAIIMSIALRLIPTLVEETGKIMNAQKARCAAFESRNIFKRAKALMPVLIPLFVSSFRRADELADAMDSRCYRGAKGRTRMKKLRFALRDLFGFLFLAAMFFGVLILKYNWFGLNTWLFSLIGIG